MDERAMSCCGVSPRRTVSDLFDRGLRRSRKAPLAHRGAPCRDANGLTARFSVASDGNGKVVAEVGFQASACVTLIAYCELVAEMAAGRDFDCAATLAPADLVSAVSGVPPLKQDRALLAIAAFREALDRVEARRIPNDFNPRDSHESRLYLRHAAP
jgi:hypothetical protein